jgi:hypothetical protein
VTAPSPPPTEWIDAGLAAAGLERTGSVELFRERPWGTVTSTSTTGGTVWCKAPGPTVAFEVPLYALLAEAVPGSVLEPIAIDREHGWVLLPDGGKSIGEVLEGDELLDAFEAALPRYAELQIALIPRAAELLDAGVADMRPARMPGRLDEMLEAVPRLLPLVGQAGDERTLEQVADLRPAFAEWCDRLEGSPVDPSLDHNDLHHYNVLTGGRFFDWGDAVLACPLASARALGFVPGGERIAERLRDSYLEPYTAFGSRAELIETLELACRVGAVARAYVWHRAVSADLEAAPETYLRGPIESLEGLLDDGWLGRT